MNNSSDSVRRAVILTALAVEYDAARDFLTNIEPRVHEGSRYEVGCAACDGVEWQILLAEIGAGNDNAAAEAERAVQYFRPDVALFVGVAGGLKDVKIGDVVAASHVYGYHSGKASAQFEPRPNVGESSYDLVQVAMVVRREWNRAAEAAASQAFVGKIAAGEQVVSNTKSAAFQFLRQQYGDALAVEMEGRGFLAATHMNSRVRALVIRGISDLVDGKTDADRGGSQSTAARNASRFAIRVLGKLGNLRARDP